MEDKKQMTIIPRAPQGHTWESLMALALEEAQKAQQEDEIPVGALVVSEDGQILSKAHNLTRRNCDPTAHAEILALREAALKKRNFRLLNTFLIVTLEPCIMCLGALREARVAGVVFALKDKESGAICSRFDGLEIDLNTPKPWFMSGVCEEESLKLLQDFFAEKRK